MVRFSKAKKIIITLACLIVLAVVFSFINAFSDTVTAPHNDNAAPTPPAASPTPVMSEPEPSITPPVSDERAEPDDPGDSEEPENHEDPEPPPELPKHVTINMSPSDIFLGSLLLINHDHAYKIPELSAFVEIPAEKTQSYMVTGMDTLILASVIEPLNDMMDAYYEETGRRNITVNSAFRDYDRQQDILNYYISLFGRTEALRWASPPGHSEHQAGMALDFGVYSDGAVSAFTGTGATAWFTQNSWKYGFILRYPANKTDITRTAHEPWHFRHVGLPHAYIIHQNGWCFEEYHEQLAQHTENEPYTAEDDKYAYEIYYTQSLEINIPFNCEFDISGNNIDGFIVTLYFLI